MILADTITQPIELTGMEVSAILILSCMSCMLALIVWMVGFDD